MWRLWGTLERALVGVNQVGNGVPFSRSERLGVNDCALFGFFLPMTRV